MCTRVLYFYLTLPFLLATSGCSGSVVAPQSEAAAVTIQTAQPSYEASKATNAHSRSGRPYDVFQWTMRLSFTNRTESTLYLRRCGREFIGTSLEKWTDGKWTPALDRVCPLIVLPPVVIAPGETYTEETAFWGCSAPESGLCGPEFNTKVPGTYRVKAAVFATREAHDLGRDPLANDAAVSNPFTLTVP